MYKKLDENSVFYAKTAILFVEQIAKCTKKNAKIKYGVCSSFTFAFY